MTTKRRSFITALEPRVLLDGAFLVDAAQAFDAAQPTDGAVDIPDAVSPVQTPRREVVFIDAALPDYQVLANGIDRTADVYVISADDDGFAVMAQILDGQANIDAVHVFGHGADGVVTLGSAQLTADNLAQYDVQLAQIGAALTAEGDILLYGCNSAAGADGAAVVESIAQMTQADIAASDDITGASGDWTLEHESGAIETDSFEIVDYQHDLPTASFTITIDGVSRSKSLSYDTSGGGWESGKVGWLSTSTKSSASYSVTASGLQSSQSWRVLIDDNAAGVTPTSSSRGSTSGIKEVSGTGNTTKTGTVGIDGATDVAIWIGSYTPAPVITNQSSTTVNEGYLTSSYFVDYYATNTNSWSLGGTNGSSFTIDGNGRVYFRSSPDYESKTSYTFTVYASGPGGSDSDPFTVYINNLNDNAPYISNPQTTVNYNENATSNVIDLNVGDADASLNSHTWSLISGYGDNSAFSINSSTGVVTFNASPDYEQKSTYLVKAQVSDGTYTATDDFTVAVQDVNEAPILTSISAPTGGTEDTAYTISFEDLVALTTMSDPDSDALTFQVGTIHSGSLLKDGTAVTAALCWSKPDMDACA